MGYEGSPVGKLGKNDMSLEELMDCDPYLRLVPVPRLGCFGRVSTKSLSLAVKVVVI